MYLQELHSVHAYMYFVNQNKSNMYMYMYVLHLESFLKQKKKSCSFLSEHYFWNVNTIEFWMILRQDFFQRLWKQFNKSIVLQFSINYIYKHDFIQYYCNVVTHQMASNY